MLRFYKLRWENTHKWIINYLNSENNWLKLVKKIKNWKTIKLSNLKSKTYNFAATSDFINKRSYSARNDAYNSERKNMSNFMVEIRICLILVNRSSKCSEKLYISFRPTCIKKRTVLPIFKVVVLLYYAKKVIVCIVHSLTRTMKSVSFT